MSIPPNNSQRFFIITTGNNSSNLTLRAIRPPSLIAPLTNPIGPRLAASNIRTITAPVSSSAQNQRASTIYIGHNGQNQMAPRISFQPFVRRPVVGSARSLLSTDTIRAPLPNQNFLQFPSPSRPPFQSRPIRPAPASFQCDQPPSKVRLITSSGALVWENGAQAQPIPRPPLNRQMSPLERPLRYPRQPPPPPFNLRGSVSLVPQFRPRPLLPPLPPPLPLALPSQPPLSSLDEEQPEPEPPKPKRRTAPLFAFGPLPVPCRLSPQRIRMIMHSSPDVNVVSHESLMLTTKAAVVFNPYPFMSLLVRLLISSTSFHPIVPLRCFRSSSPSISCVSRSRIRLAP